MSRSPIPLSAAFFIFLLLSGAAGVSQKSKVIVTTIDEPGVYSLSKLYHTADIVALVKVLSGDTEHYSVAVYKGEVIKAFKGSSAKQILYFGPFVGNQLGSDYVVFLRRQSSPLSPKSQGQLTYGTVQYAAIFNGGYTSMETSYQCVFDGKEPSEKCDYGVRVCTDYIELPDSVPVFPPISEDTDFGCRWVRKKDFLAVLGAIAKAPVHP